MEYLEPSAWDEFEQEKERQEEQEELNSLQQFNYRFLEGPDKGKIAFSLLGPFKDHSYQILSDDGVLHLEDSDALIDYMRKFKIVR